MTDHLPVPTARSSHRRLHFATADLLPATVSLVAVLAYLLFERATTGASSGLPLDDSWIHLVFARSLAAGAGLAFPAGEIVPASTAPLWTALLSLLGALPFDRVLAVKFLGAALAVLGVVESGRLARALNLPPLLAFLSALAVASTDWLAWAALSAMEIPLFVLLSVAGMRLHAEEIAERRKGRLSLLVLALAALARPEGLLLLLLAFGERVASGAGSVSDRLGAIAADVAIGVSVLAPVAVFNLAVSGSPLPTTFAAKAEGVSRLLPDLHTLYLALGLFFRSHPLYLLLAAGGGCALLARRLSGHRLSLLPALWLFALPCALSLLGAHGGTVLGNFGRYLFPLFPPLVVVGSMALATPLDALRRGPAPRLAKVAGWGLAFALVLGPALAATARGAGRYVQGVTNVESSDLRLARWLAPRLAPEALIAVADVGAMGFVLPNRLVDLGALITPELRDELRREGKLDPQEALARYLERRGVDFVAAYPRFLPAFEADPVRFVPLVRLAIPNNITMAGDELVLYRTGWCRYPLREMAEPAAAPDPTRRPPP